MMYFCALYYITYAINDCVYSKMLLFSIDFYGYRNQSCRGRELTELPGWSFLGFSVNLSTSRPLKSEKSRTLKPIPIPYPCSAKFLSEENPI